MIPPPASSGEELFSGACCYKYFYLLASHLITEKQANYLRVDMLRTHSKSKQLPVKPGIELWNLSRGQKSNEICLVDLFGRIYCFN